MRIQRSQCWRIISSAKCPFTRSAGYKKPGEKQFLSVLKNIIRVESAVSLSVMLTQEENSQDAFIIGFGGGHGLLNISWGANESIAKKAYNALAELGFEKDDSVTGMYL